jgi:hypothetical protein
MPHITERIEVASPPSIAADGIERYLRSKDDVIDLVVPLRALGLPTELELERPAKVEFLANRRDKLMLGRSHEQLSLTWGPHHGGPYPTFKGKLTIRPLSGKTELELAGTYEPPFGAFGAVFDAAVGHRIAQAAARALLRELKAELEREFATFKSAIETGP